MSNAMVTPDRINTSGISTFGFGCLILFLFLTFSRATDNFLSGLYLPLIFACLALVSVIASGNLGLVLRSRPAAFLLGFTGWLIVATPFSYWRGGSVALLQEWAKSFLVFVLIAGLTNTVSQCRRVAATLALASTAVVAQALLFGNREVLGRLTVGQGVLSNPNDLAQLVLNGAPFLLLPVLNRRAVPLRLLGLGAVLAAIAVIASTGSRGALFAVAGMGLALLLRQGMIRRIQIALGGVVILLIVVATLPPDIVRRYGIFLDAEVTTAADVATVESAAQRLQLLHDGIDLTLEHPFVGVGPGVFAAASADRASTIGQAAAWRETHNAYVQVSSEAGLPALAFFIATIAWCLTVQLGLLRTLSERHDAKLLANVTLCLFVSFVGYTVVCMFSSVAYQVYLPAFAGLSLAFRRCAGEDGKAAAGGYSRSTISNAPLALGRGTR
jgi:O-antigen ligase